MNYIGGYENDYLSNLEAETEQREGEKIIERIDYSSQAAKSDEEINIEKATISSLEILSDLMVLGEDVEDAVKVTVKERKKVIKKLLQEGRLNKICDAIRNKINEYLEAEKEKNEEGR